jgi:aspartyl-tRNA(Asn)/glutamyl-tRNA(Gln) amidotransferase subunit B
MKFDSNIVIGLEIHLELNTNTKLFCSCSRKKIEGEIPNSRTCPTCLGMPGSKPVLNKKAVDFALKCAIALNCDIAPELIFSRKSYFYPDMPKNYQITQYEVPLGKGGNLNLSTGENIALKRVHMEEDPGALVHIGDIKQSPYVLVDYNRAGNPLIEIVTEPELRSPEQARDFMKQLITIVEYLDIFNMQQGIIKADANVSIKEANYSRVEIKNITGFKEIEKALDYELIRQRHEVNEGKHIKVETRGWDADKGITYSLRTKESEEDYGYIIDPDLVVTEITKDWIDKIKAKMPELAEAKLKKFLEDHKIEETTAKVIAKDKKLAELYEDVVEEIDQHLASKWIRRDLARVLRYHKKSLKESGITSKNMISLLKLINNGSITDSVGQQILEKMCHEIFDVKEYVERQGLGVIEDTKRLENLCKEAIDESPQAVAEYKNGKERALHFVVGKVMKKARGKAKPDHVLEILKKFIE